MKRKRRDNLAARGRAPDGSVLRRVKTKVRAKPATKGMGARNARGRAVSSVPSVPQGSNVVEDEPVVTKEDIAFYQEDEAHLETFLATDVEQVGKRSRGLRARKRVENRMLRQKFEKSRSNAEVVMSAEEDSDGDSKASAQVHDDDDDDDDDDDNAGKAYAQNGSVTFDDIDSHMSDSDLESDSKAHATGGLSDRGDNSDSDDVLAPYERGVRKAKSWVPDSKMHCPLPTKTKDGELVQENPEAYNSVAHQMKEAFKQSRKRKRLAEAEAEGKVDHAVDGEDEAIRSQGMHKRKKLEVKEKPTASQIITSLSFHCLFKIDFDYSSNIERKKKEKRGQHRSKDKRQQQKTQCSMHAEVRGGV